MKSATGEYLSVLSIRLYVYLFDMEMIIKLSSIAMKLDQRDKMNAYQPTIDCGRG
jgi:hypothetical protein